MEVLFLDKSLLCILAQSIAHGHASSPQQYPTHAGTVEQNPAVFSFGNRSFSLHSDIIWLMHINNYNYKHNLMEWSEECYP